MAVPANTVQTYTQKGIREDLNDMIYDISPTETPFQTNIGTETSTNTLSQWETDALAAQNLANAQVQGDDAANDTQDSPALLGNYQQILRKVVGVAATTEAVKFAARKSEMARLIAKRGKEVKRDLEGIMLSNQIGVAGSAAVAGNLAGLLTWIRTNVATVGVGGANPPAPTLVPATGRTDGTQRVFSEALLKQAIQIGYDNGAEPNLIMVNSTNKQVASTFAGVATKTYYQSAVKETAVIGAIDTYVSDFGTFSFQVNRFQRTRDCFIIDPSMAKKMFLRPFSLQDLAKTGDSTKKLLVGEVTLKVNNEKALALVPDLI